MSNLLFITLLNLFSINCISAQTLLGNYQFWDFYGSRVHDYSPGHRDAEMKYSTTSPFLTDRGLYLRDNVVFLFPKNIYGDFPAPYTSIVISVWYLPTDTSLIFNLKSNKPDNSSISITLQKINTTNLKFLIGGSNSESYSSYSSSLTFSIWHLLTIECSVISGSSLISLYLNNEDLALYKLKIPSLDFSFSNMSWEMGGLNNKIMGYLHEIWWHDFSNGNTQLTSSRMIEYPCGGCTYGCAKTPYTVCLKPVLNPYQNSNEEFCTDCLGLSCDEDQYCIADCKYRCVNAGMCRSDTTPICPDLCPYGCEGYCVPNTDRCYACRLGYYLSTIDLGKCTISVLYCKEFNLNSTCKKCELGYYLTSPNFCNECLIANCILCYDASIGVQMCKDCGSYFIHIDGTCQPTCPIGYYEDIEKSPKKCVACTAHCISCEMDKYFYKVCKVCESTPVMYYPTLPDSPEMCSSNCPMGSFYCVTEPDGCCDCLNGCAHCSDTITCDQCGIMNYHISSIIPHECPSCSIPYCLVCYSAFDCNECLPGYAFYQPDTGLSCLKDCTKDDYLSNPTVECITRVTTVTPNYSIRCYPVSNTIQCNKCEEISTYSTSSLNCSGPTLCPSNCVACYLDINVIKCSVCSYEFYLDPINQTSCNSTCPNRYYTYFLDSTKKGGIYVIIIKTWTCKACSEAKCLVCANNLCTLCETDYYLTPSAKCTLICPESTFSIMLTKKCIYCLQYCKTCRDAVTCVECISTHSLMIKGTSYSCVVNCGSGYYADFTPILKCIPCGIQYCINCENNADKVECTKCKSGYVSRLMNGIWICIEAQCPENCNSCKIVGNEIICESCESGNWIQTDSMSCGQTCPDYFYGDIQQQKCVECMENCKTCSKNGEEVRCVQCGDGFFIQPNSDVGLCETACPEGFYADLITTECLNCQPNCSICSEYLRCTACNQGYFIQSVDSDTACSYECPVGYFLEQDTCKACFDNCELCRSSRDCKKCKDGYFLFVSMGKYYCIETVLPGYYDQYSVLIPCTGQCDPCQNLDECGICVSSLYVTSREEDCFKGCGEGFYAIEYQCFPCIEGCRICNDHKTCKECKEELYLQINKSEVKCGPDCTHGFYKDESEPKACKRCHESCNTCVDSLSCVDCNDEFYLQISDGKQICVSSCPVDLYPNKSSGTCIECPSLCIECGIKSGDLDCKICVDFAYKSGRICECYDIENQTSQEECPESCPDDMEIDLSTSSCYTLTDIEKTLKKVSSAAAMACTASIPLRILMSSSESAWAMMSTIQILLFIGMINVNLPVILKEDLKAQKSYLIAYDLFEEISFSSIKPFTKAYDFNYSTPAFIINVGKPACYIAFIILFQVLIFVVYKIPNAKMKALCQKVMKNLRYGVYLRFLIQMYLELLVPALLQLKHVRSI